MKRLMGIRLFEEPGLRGNADGAGRAWFVERTEVAEAYANEAKPLPRVHIDAAAQGQGDSGQVVAGRGRGWRREASGEGAELLCFELEDHGARDAGFPARGHPDLFGEAADGGVGVFDRYVLLKRVFSGD